MHVYRIDEKIKVYARMSKISMHNNNKQHYKLFQIVIELLIDPIYLRNFLFLSFVWMLVLFRFLYIKSFFFLSVLCGCCCCCCCFCSIVNIFFAISTLLSTCWTFLAIEVSASFFSFFAYFLCTSVLYLLYLLSIHHLAFILVPKILLFFQNTKFQAKEDEIHTK